MKLLALHIQQTHRSQFDSAVLSSITGRVGKPSKEEDDNHSVASCEASLLITPAVRDSPRPPRKLVQPDTPLRLGIRQTLSTDHQLVLGRRQKQGLELRFCVPEEVHYYETIDSPPQEKGRLGGENGDVKGVEGKRERSEEELMAALVNEDGFRKTPKPKQDKKRLKRIDKRKHVHGHQDLAKGDVNNEAKNKELVEKCQIVTVRPAKCYRRPIPLPVDELETYRGQPQPQPPSNPITGLTLLEEEEDFSYTDTRDKHSTGDTLFRCNLCRKGFVLNEKLLNHLKSDHMKVSRALKPQYGCGQCPASFFNNSFLLKHSVSHSIKYVQDTAMSVGRK